MGSRTTAWYVLRELEMALALDGQKLVPLETAAAGTGYNGRATDPGGILESNRPVELAAVRH